MGWSNAVSRTQHGEHAHKNIVRAAANISPERLRLQGSDVVLPRQLTDTRRRVWIQSKKYSATDPSLL
eukprot:1695392-Amphidinium_carterae.1